MLVDTVKMIKRKFLTIALMLSMASVLSACYSDAEVSDANKVITALPQEIDGCSFITDVDTIGARATLEQARFELKLKASRVGATHLVETHVYPGVLARGLLGVGLSARAYKCPAGKGPKLDNDEGKTKYEIPAYAIYFNDDGGGLFHH